MIRTEQELERAAMLLATSLVAFHREGVITASLIKACTMVEKAKDRIDGLLNANNAEVERRRAAESRVEKVESP